MVKIFELLQQLDDLSYHLSFVEEEYERSISEIINVELGAFLALPLLQRISFYKKTTFPIDASTALLEIIHSYQLRLEKLEKELLLLTDEQQIAKMFYACRIGDINEMRRLHEMEGVSLHIRHPYHNGTLVHQVIASAINTEGVVTHNQEHLLHSDILDWLLRELKESGYLAEVINARIQYDESQFGHYKWLYQDFNYNGQIRNKDDRIPVDSILLLGHPACSSYFLGKTSLELAEIAYKRNQETLAYPNRAMIYAELTAAAFSEFLKNPINPRGININESVLFCSEEEYSSGYFTGQITLNNLASARRQLEHFSNPKEWTNPPQPQIQQELLKKLKDLQEKTNLVSRDINETLSLLRTIKSRWVQDFQQAVDVGNYQDVKLCLEEGLAINSVVFFNEKDRNLFEYTAMKQPGDLRFAALVMYYDRLRGTPLITFSMIEICGKEIYPDAKGDSQFIKELYLRLLALKPDWGKEFQEVWLKEFQQAVNTGSYADTKLYLKLGLAINSVISFNGEDRNLFEYAALKQPHDLRFAALVMYYDRLHGNPLVSTHPIIQNLVKKIYPNGIASDSEQFFENLQKKYEYVMQDFGSLASLSVPDWLLSVTYALTGNIQEEIEVKNLFKDFYKKFYNRNDLKILVAIPALTTIYHHARNINTQTSWEGQFKVFADAHSPLIDHLYLYYESGIIKNFDALGLQYINNIFIGIQQNGGDKADIASSLIHELTHYIAKKVYNNGGNPYVFALNNDTVTKEKFNKMCNAMRGQSEFLGIDDEYYKKYDQQNSELIARTSSFLWNRQDINKAKDELRRLSPELCQFYFDTFLNDCNNYYKKLECDYNSQRAAKQQTINTHLANIETKISDAKERKFEKQILIAESEQLKHAFQEDKVDSDFAEKLNLKDKEIARLKNRVTELESLSAPKPKPAKFNNFSANSVTFKKLLQFGKWDVMRNINEDTDAAEFSVKFIIKFTSQETSATTALSELQSFIRSEAPFQLKRKRPVIIAQFDQKCLIVKCEDEQQTEQYNDWLKNLKLEAAPPASKLEQQCVVS